MCYATRNCGLAITKVVIDCDRAGFHTGFFYVGGKQSRMESVHTFTQLQFL